LIRLNSGQHGQHGQLVNCEFLVLNWTPGCSVHWLTAALSPTVLALTPGIVRVWNSSLRQSLQAGDTPQSGGLSHSKFSIKPAKVGRSPNSLFDGMTQTLKIGEKFIFSAV
jgi:hypothetical protein